MDSGIEITAPKTYVDNYVKFGPKCAINIKKIRENNIVLMKYQKSLGPICSFRGSHRINNDMKYFLLDLLDTNEVNADLQKKLDEESVKLLERMLKVAKLTDEVKYKKYVKNISDYIERFEILRGGFLAGNHSQELRDEVIEIVRLLSSPVVDRISRADADEIIESLT